MQRRQTQAQPQQIHALQERERESEKHKSRKSNQSHNRKHNRKRNRKHTPAHSGRARTRLHDARELSEHPGPAAPDP